jgi:hypothetical protein
MGYDVALIETGEAISRRLQSLLQLPSSAAGFTRLSLYATGEINGAFAAEIIGSQQCRIERIVL